MKKKYYLLIFTLIAFSYSYAQSPIVTVDRENITGPTTTGNDPAISSIGLTRGAGVNQRNSNDFTSRDWNVATQADAETNDKYLEWSVTSGASNTIEITELDIRLRRNNNGPTDWQIFYSTDNFATAGTAVSTPQTLAAVTNTIFNFNSLGIITASSQTVTFRLYAWGAATGGGWIRVKRESSWTDFGIALPGIRLTGIITPTSVNSSESNIITSVGFDPADNIDYQIYNVTSGLTTANSIKIGEFIIQDGGDDLLDADLLPTILTDIGFDITGYANIAALALFDGTTNISETSIVIPTTVFNNINSGTGISAGDGGTKTFDVYATFNSIAIDNEQLQLTVSSASADGILGSVFTDFSAGGASSSISGDDNRLEVTRTQLIFNQEPSDVNQFEVMAPAPTVLGVDSNGSIDLDYSGDVLIGSAIAIDPSSTIIISATAGEATFNNLLFSGQGSDVLIATPLDPGITFGVSSSFNVNGPLITLAKQDFDGSTPEWTYTNDTAFFDNGWGTDGYYGIIDVSSASPLNHQLFSNNILGENDLNDEGGGTSGFATVTFAEIDISAHSNIKVSFDWDVIGYVNNQDDARYELFYDGVSQGIVYLLDGNFAIDTDQGSVSIDVPDAINMVSLQLSIRDNGNNGFSGFDNFLVSTTFSGLVYKSSAWTPFAPSDLTALENALVYDGNYIINSDIEIKDLVVFDAGTINVQAGSSLHVNGNLASNENVILGSSSTQYSSLIVDGNVIGNVIYNRHVNTNAASGGNDLISAPVTGETFGELASDNTNIVSNPSNVTEKLFGPFDKITGLYLTYDTNVPAEASITLDAGIGYRAASTDGLNFSFNGSVNTGTINVPIVIAGPNNEEWNLVGNPYPSYIKLVDFLAVNNTQFALTTSGVYGYDGDASNGWEIWNQAYSDANPSALITPGQGFLVSSALASGTITFSPGMRSIGSSDDFISGRLPNSPISHLELSINGSSQAYKTDFYFTDNASLGLDSGYDSDIFGSTAPQFSIYSHLVEESTGNDIAIQSLSTTDLLDVTIPLGINVSQGQQVTVSITNSTLPSVTEVYLEDNVANTFTLLNDNDYTFTASTNITETGRFFIRFSEASLSIDETELNSLEVYTTTNPKTLFIKGNLTEKTTVRLFDIQGRLVIATVLDNTSNNNQIDISNLGTGIYVVSLTSKSLTKTQKVIIR